MTGARAGRGRYTASRRRAALSVALVGSIAAITACHGGPHVTFVVTTAVDAADAQPGDGVCEATSGAGDCSVRAAIQEANATDAATVVTVELAAGETYPLTVGGTDQAGAVGDLDVTRDVTVAGNGSTITGELSSIPVFEVHAGTLAVTGATLVGAAGFGGVENRREGGAVLNHATVQLTDVSLRGGSRQGGAALHQTAGTTTLLRTRVTGSVGGFGTDPWAAIWIGGGALSLLDSEIADNIPITEHHSRDYAGIRIEAGAHAGVIRSTIAGHDTTIFDPRWFPSSIPAPGDGIDSRGSVDIIRSTVTGNGFDLAISPGGSITVSGSAIGDCGGATSGGFNLVGPVACAGTGTATDVAATDLGLGPLAWNGGPTRTRRPASSSVAVDSIPVGTPTLCDGTLATDQRGRPQPVGGGCDRGSVERQADDP